MLNVYQSNHMENLLTALSGVLRVPLPSPHMPEWIGVQTQGLGIWLGMEMSKKLGIWANVYQPFPRVLIERIFNIVLEENCPDTTCFAPDHLTWSIMALLPDLSDKPQFRAIRSYLSEDPNGLKQYQLSCRIAEVFDRYAAYRPEMVLDWDVGKADDTLSAEHQWQPLLWRALVDRHGPSHVAAASMAFFSHLRSSAPPPGITDKACSVRHFNLAAAIYEDTVRFVRRYGCPYIFPQSLTGVLGLYPFPAGNHS